MNPSKDFDTKRHLVTRRFEKKVAQFKKLLLRTPRQFYRKMKDFQPLFKILGQIFFATVCKKSPK